MATRMKKAWRGVIRGHLKDIKITCGQALGYFARHEDDTPPLFSAGEASAVQSIIDLMTAKLAQQKPA